MSRSCSQMRCSNALPASSSSSSKLRRSPAKYCSSCADDRARAARAGDRRSASSRALPGNVSPRQAVLARTEGQRAERALVDVPDRRSCRALEVQQRGLGLEAAARSRRGRRRCAARGGTARRSAGGWWPAPSRRRARRWGCRRGWPRRGRRPSGRRGSPPWRAGPRAGSRSSGASRAGCRRPGGCGRSTRRARARVCVSESREACSTRGETRSASCCSTASSSSAGRPTRTRPSRVAPTMIVPSGESWRSKATSISPERSAAPARSRRIRSQAAGAGPCELAQGLLQWCVLVVVAHACETPRAVIVRSVDRLAT